MLIALLLAPNFMATMQCKYIHSALKNTCYTRVNDAGMQSMQIHGIIT